MEASNAQLIRMIQGNKLFFVSKFKNVHNISFLYMITRYSDFKLIEGYTQNKILTLLNTSNQKDLIEYHLNCMSSLRMCNFLFETYYSHINTKQILYTDNILNRYCAEFNPEYYTKVPKSPIKPWFNHLNTKKVLLISDCKKNISEYLHQLESKEYLIVSLEENWKVNLENIYKELSKQEFDVSVIQCGIYGLLIGDYIKRYMGKSCINLG